MEEPPDQSAHEKQRDENGDERDAHRDHREADLSRALEPRRHRAVALFHEAEHIFDHDDRVIHDEADGDRHGHQREVVERVAAQVHHAEGARERERHRDARDEGRPEAAEEKKDDHHHERDADQEGELHVLDGRADRRRAVAEQFQLHARRQPELRLRHRLADAIHRFDHVCIGLFENDEQHRGLQAVPAAEPVVLHAVHDFRERTEQHGRPVFLREDEVLVLVRAEELIVAVNRVRRLVAVHAALRLVHVGLREKCAHVLKARSRRGERGGVHLHAHCGLCAAADHHLGHAFELAQPLADDLIRRLEDLAHGIRIRSHREHHDGRIRRVGFFVSRRRGEIHRQIARRGIDRRLHVARRSVHLAREVKLHADRSPAERAARSDFGDAGNLAEVSLERRGERRGDRLRIRAGQARAHGDHREIHPWNRRNRQQMVSDDPEDKQPDREQRRGDRTPDEWLADVHGKVLSTGTAGPASGKVFCARPRRIQREKRSR